jgi:hypothetical protein
VRLLGFGTVVALAVIVLHGYLWWRLVRGTTRPGRVRRWLTVLTVVLAVLLPIAATSGRRLPTAVAAPLDWIAYSWLGVALYAFLTLLVLEPVRLLIRLWGRRLPVGSGARRAPDERSDRSGSAADGTAPGRGVPVRSGARRVPDERSERTARRNRGTAPGRGAVRRTAMGRVPPVRLERTLRGF